MFNIGTYKMDTPLVLAPMAGITDYPFRQLCRRLGAGLATSEMLSSDINLWHSKKSQTRLPQKNELTPRIIQIAGNNPRQMAEAAIHIQTQGADIIDINMGCPAKKVCKKAAGSALMKNHTLVNEIVSAITSNVDIPVTLKIRTGWSEFNLNAIQIAQIAQKNNISALFVHGRHKEQKFNGFSEYETVRQIKHNVDIPVIANGDITTRDDLSFILDYTQADGLMLGRSILGQPWLFSEFNHHLIKQNIIPHLSQHNITAIEATSDATKHTIIIDHIRSIHHYYNDYSGVMLARKHISHYMDKLKLITTLEKSFSRIQMDYDNLRREILSAKSESKQLTALHKAVDFLVESNISTANSPNLKQVA